MRKREIIAWVRKHNANPVKQPVVDCCAVSGTAAQVRAFRRWEEEYQIGEAALALTRDH